MAERRAPKVEPQDAWRHVMRVAADPQTGLVASLPGRLDADVLEAAVAALLAAEPVLACRFVEDGRSPRFEPRAGAPARPLVEDSSEPAEAALAWAAEPVDPFAEPLFAAAVFRGPAGDVLALRVHHLAADAYGTREIGHRLAEAYGAVARGARPALAAARSRGMFQVLRRVWPHRSVLAAYAENAGSPGWGLPVAGEPGRRSYAVRSVSAAPLEVLAASYGTDVEAVVVTALFRALTEVLDAPASPPMSLHVAVDLRRHIRSGGPSCAACNLSAHETLRLACAPEATFEDALGSVSAALAVARGDRAGLRSAVLVELAGRMGPSVLARATAEPAMRDRERGLATPLVADLGVLDPERLRFGALVPDSAFVLPTVGLPPYACVGFSRFLDTLSLTAGYPPDSVSAEVLPGILERAAAQLSAADPAEEAEGAGVADLELRR